LTSRQSSRKPTTTTDATRAGLQGALSARDSHCRPIIVDGLVITNIHGTSRMLVDSALPAPRADVQTSARAEAALCARRRASSEAGRSVSRPRQIVRLVHLPLAYHRLRRYIDICPKSLPLLRDRTVGQPAPPGPFVRPHHPHHLGRHHGPRGGPSQARRWKAPRLRLLSSVLPRGRPVSGRTGLAGSFLREGAAVGSPSTLSLPSPPWGVI
jgi:hypothetical protein